jgi:hypothetical protein
MIRADPKVIEAYLGRSAAEMGQVSPEASPQAGPAPP